MTKIEKLKRIVRVHKSLSDDKADEGSYVEKGFPVVKFDSHRYPFVMLESYCSNPECDCNEALLKFVEIDETGTPIVNPIKFYLFLDLKTWQENRRPQRPEVVQRLVDELLSELTDEMKSRLKKNYEYMKQKARNAAKFKASIDQINRGEMFSYTDVFGNIKSVLSGGTAVAFRFEYEGRNILIDDQYCINPRCRCEAVRLVFFEFWEDTRVLLDMFDCRFFFKTGLEIEEHPECTKEEAVKIFKEWQKSDPNIIDVLKERYSEMKKVGQDLVLKHDRPSKHILNVVKKEKIARNMPCPCGSGKKYKKCCGKL